RGIPVSADDRLRREIIERLMCDLAVDLDRVARRHGASVGSFDPELALLAGLEEDGVVVRDRHTIRVTDAGRPLIRAVCAVFDRYLKAGEARHSKAV
ncbi:MAG: coproporphyrinogen III oxidase, partial [Alphaproteobacteria bacterium]|nr:coproporphyrinogen III oxidase [Alphaproteobacteria bacterium]